MVNETWRGEDKDWIWELYIGGCGEGKREGD